MSEAPTAGWSAIDREPPSFDNDGLATWSKNLEFLRDERFMSAYKRGMDSGHRMGREPGSKTDIHLEYRVHIILWAAQQAALLPGDFVECGVNTGCFSLAICEYLDFNNLKKDFWLFDTFVGMPPEQITEREAGLGRFDENANMYEECYDIALENFAPFPRARLVRGMVPDTLTTVDIGKVCYLSIDMNIVEPEIAAIEYFWDKLVPGAPIVLDDYGWAGFAPQKEAMDAFARTKGVPIALLPTGQGLMIKPPKRRWRLR
ncbi:MAG: TylF/MycF/NovP-related O-methyltransferase [Aeromicrobium sp.]